MILPPPLVPSDCDLRDFRFMPLEVSRLARSKMWRVARRRPEVGFYAVNLWAAAWHELPAGSLEDDDDALAEAAMCESSRWAAVREDTLRGWVRCNDGRIYHPVVCAKALEAWIEKLARRRLSDAGNCKRYGHTFDAAHHEAELNRALDMLRALDPNSTKLPKTSRKSPAGIATGSQGIGTGRGEREESLDSCQNRAAVAGDDADYLAFSKAIDGAAEGAPPKAQPRAPSPAKTRAPRAPADETFAEIWKAWPQKGRSAKAKSQTAWTANKAPAEDKARAVRAYLASKDARKDDGAFVPALERWIRDKLDSWLEIGASRAAAASAAPAPTRQRPPLHRTEEGDRFARTMAEIVGPQTVAQFLRECEFVSLKPLRIRAPDELTHHKLTAGTFKHPGLRALFTALAAAGVEVLPPIASERASTC